MFIFVTYKDPPELSTSRTRILEEEDTSTENMLLVNPVCFVRVMLEFIRKKCRLAQNTMFDLCEENGGLKNLFSYPTFAYASHQFEHKKNYYLIVFKQETEKTMAIIPQLNRENKLFLELQTKIRRFLLTGDTGGSTTNTAKTSAKGSKKKG